MYQVPRQVPNFASEKEVEYNLKIEFSIVPRDGMRRTTKICFSASPMRQLIRIVPCRFRLPCKGGGVRTTACSLVRQSTVYNTIQESTFTMIKSFNVQVDFRTGLHNRLPSNFFVLIYFTYLVTYNTILLTIGYK